ncbi:hypothetical protein GCM10007049_35750 [Echinicola pacifica]|uniref:RHS repeat-associated core domain-containing protein n=1 Tax=Echinicola pacifica TaxID=346377 RepID=A0A918Q9T4_9BACT|nr:RHS repeat-associated core domain-containing protein [Echinicola pacifica]GGZ39239.1 hypothetical protein GCM10007049_35750 [Echinicola pacifica]
MFFDDFKVSHENSLIVQKDDYYPFGMSFNSYSRLGSVGQKYLYNGKERQELTGWDDFGARMYDPAIGRWGVVDPLADHPNQVDKSPYAYAWNNPVNLTDPDGRCPFCPWLDAVVDIGFALYDVGEITYDYVTTGEVDPISVAALTADVAAIAIPMTTGAGLAVRATAKTVNAVDNANDVRKAVDKTTDAIKKIGPAGDAGATVTKQVPSDWTMKTSNSKQGTVFKDPKNPSGNNVRVQSGNPNRPNPAQQKPYVKQTQNGKTVDVNGKQVHPKSKEAHIPKEDFKFNKQ